MKFKIVSKIIPNKEKYGGDDFEKACKLSAELKSELGDFMRSFVVFGSGSHYKEGLTANDIDVLILVNDVTLILSPEVIEGYRIIVHDCASKISSRFHITTQKLTVMWDAVRQGDPLITNVLRDGYAIYDSGIFVPMQHLLLQGRIRPTKEAVWGYYTRAPMQLTSAKRHLLGASFDLYWACMDSAHAALMSIGHMPVTPEKVPEMLDLFLVRKGLLEPDYVKKLNFFYTLSKRITHREIQEIKGEEFARYAVEAENFVNRMRKVVEAHKPPL